MKPAAAVVLLLAIAGIPATTLICIGWCQPGAVRVDVSCHHHGSGAGVAVTDGDGTCAGLLTTSPYLKEESQVTCTVMSARAPYSLARAEGEAQLVSMLDGIDVVLPRATSALVLRL